jgi:hypothetical protein
MFFKQGFRTGRSVVLQAAFLEILVFWDVTLRRLVNNYHDHNGWQSPTSLRTYKE